MDGIKLLTAARIIAKAGEQIETMIEILKDKLIEGLTDEQKKISAVYLLGDGENSDGNWMIKSFFWDIALIKEEKRKNKKPYAHIAIKIVLYDEDELQISGWEPSLYIMYGPGEEAFNFEDSLWLSSAKDDEWNLDGNRLWRFKEDDEDGWGFVLPLVKMDSEKALVEQIIEPVKKLLGDLPPSDPFPSNSVAFRFTEVNDGINILD